LRESISTTSQIIAFRNRLIHGYASISNQLVWGVIESSLPALLLEIKDLLQDEPG
jgi:uncharacterized protein with HEPN domain